MTNNILSSYINHKLEHIAITIQKLLFKAHIQFYIPKYYDYFAKPKIQKPQMKTQIRKEVTTIPQRETINGSVSLSSCQTYKKKKKLN